jgi:hypothetical protein
LVHHVEFLTGHDTQSSQYSFHRPNRPFGFLGAHSLSPIQLA